MALDGPRISRVHELPPDPSLAKAVGRHHSLETAIADLVDNSIDAGATRILVRFLQQDDAIIGLRLIDNGAGMDGDGLDAAMTFARKRSYGAGALGHFGIGLKAASLSQADILRVYSRRNGAQAAGRVIQAADPTRVAVMDAFDAQTHLDTIHADYIVDSGTVVEWAEPRTFLSSDSTDDRSRWLNERISAVTAHLGIVFHRMIAAGDVQITVDVLDLDLNESGAPRTVQQIDPFGYVSLTNDSYPAPLHFAIDGQEACGIAHIWPASQSGRPQFRLGGRPGVLAQGIYFYRNDRLVQIGGWNTLTVNRPELEYARVAIDITDALEPHVALNPEKAGIELDADLKQALLQATVGNGATFSTYLDDAVGNRREARRYTKRPVELVRPERGFGADMLEAFGATVRYHSADPINIRWRVELSESPLEIDLDRRTIWLNEQYRDIIAGPGSMEAGDAPFVKTLLVLVFSKYFEGSHLGTREKAELTAWQELLTAALRDEIALAAREVEEDG